MPWKSVPINQQVYTNVDDVSLSDRTPERINTYRNDAGATVRRPGYAEYDNLGVTAAVDGLYYWESQDLLISVAAGNIYSKTEANASTQIGNSVLQSNSRPSWADFGSTLYVANGGDIVKIASDQTVSTLSDSSIPDNVTHIAAFDTYMLALKADSAEMHYSDVLAPETWSGYFITAEQDPDNLVAMEVRWNEIWLFGTRTIERWYNDGETPFVPFDGGIISTGCEAPNTIQWIRGAFYWLNENREIVRSAGNDYEIISRPIESQIKEIGKISDAYAYYITVEGRNLYLITFPSFGFNGITFVYDVSLDEWQGQWDKWNTEDAEYKLFPLNSYTFIPNWNVHLFGDREDGKIYYFDSTSYTDGAEIHRSKWLTGHIDHGNALDKRSLKIRIRVKRGEGGNVDYPKLMLRYRDNGKRAWSNTKYLDLGKTGDYEHYISKRRLGMYRSRQYEISVTDDVPVVLADMEEWIESVPQ